MANAGAGGGRGRGGGERLNSEGYLVGVVWCISGALSAPNLPVSTSRSLSCRSFPDHAGPNERTRALQPSFACVGGTSPQVTFCCKETEV